MRLISQSACRQGRGTRFFVGSSPDPFVLHLCWPSSHEHPVLYFPQCAGPDLQINCSAYLREDVVVIGRDSCRLTFRIFYFKHTYFIHVLFASYINSY